MCDCFTIIYYNNFLLTFPCGKVNILYEDHTESQILTITLTLMTSNYFGSHSVASNCDRKYRNIHNDLLPVVVEYCY
jgi:hypothetical protein